MIRLLFIILLLGVLLAAPAQAAPTDPMRGLIWGLPPEAVQEHETAHFVAARDGRFFYLDEVRVDADYRVKALVEFRFTDQGLAGIRYDFVMEDGRDPYVTMERLMKMEAWLNDAIGTPANPDFYFRNALERAHSSRWGWALYRGDATFDFRWRAADTDIVLSARGREWKGHASLSLSRLP